MICVSGAPRFTDSFLRIRVSGRKVSTDIADRKSVSLNLEFADRSNSDCRFYSEIKIDGMLKR